MDPNRLTDDEIEAEIEIRSRRIAGISKILLQPSGGGGRLPWVLRETRRQLTIELQALRHVRRTRIELKEKYKNGRVEKWQKGLEGRVAKSFLFVQAAHTLLTSEQFDAVWTKARENYPDLDWTSTAGLGKDMPWNRQTGEQDARLGRDRPTD